MKIILLGHARHGKDTVAEFINSEIGLEFRSSSSLAAEIFLYEALKDKYGYKSYDECFEDRSNHRAEWHNLIADYNSEDPARLAKQIFETNDIYVGMRSAIELAKCREDGVVDLIIGVYNPRMPDEPRDSFNIDLWQECDFVIPNAGTLDDLLDKVKSLCDLLVYDIEFIAD